MDWITGDKFKELGEFTFSPTVKREDDYDNLPNTLDLTKLKDVNRVYTHTMYASALFDIIDGLQQRFIVITHNSDVNVDFAPPANVIMWYTQNVNIINNRVKSIPIGLENDRWFPFLHKKEKMLEKLKEPKKYKNLVYMNFNIDNNPAKRLKPYEVFKDKPWVTVDMGTNGNKFDEYIDNIYNHHFVLCPEGNGIDTHRIWETLYMDSIPITDDNITQELLYSYYPNTTYPMWKSWEDITEESLRGDFKEITEIKRGTDVHTQMLTFEYWKNKILNGE